MAKTHFLAIVVLAASTFAHAVAHSAVVQGRVVGVSDGDTITVLVQGNQRIRVRLAEIDAPESSQAFGARSKQALSALCFGKTAMISTDNKDRYGRVVSRVSCNGVDAQSHMLSSGLAWVYVQYAKDKKLFAIERQARAARAGLWSDPQPIPPWEFRRSKRK